MIPGYQVVGIDARSLIGERVLISAGYGNTVEEVKVLEVSPSGKHIKLQGPHGNKYWKMLADVKFVEQLARLEAHPQKAAT